MRVIEILESSVKSAISSVRVDVDAPKAEGGAWFVDFTNGKKKVVVEWRPSRGFGISTPATAGYGEGPHEVYPNVAAAAERVIALLNTGAQTQAASDAMLRQLREERRMSQMEMADLLGVTQAAVSKLEHRTDMNISTLQSFVTALGGHLELIAKFPERAVTLRQFAESEPGGTKR
jgi:DNA-binding XRE family transcriptional regulator